MIDVAKVVGGVQVPQYARTPWYSRKARLRFTEGPCGSFCHRGVTQTLMCTNAMSARSRAKPELDSSGLDADLESERLELVDEAAGEEVAAELLIGETWCRDDVPRNDQDGVTAMEARFGPRRRAICQNCEAR